MCALLSWDCQDDIDNLLILSHLLEILFKIHAACSRILSIFPHDKRVVWRKRDIRRQSLTSQIEPQERTNLAVHLKKVQSYSF